MTAGGSSGTKALLRALAAGRRAAEVGTAFGDGARAIAAAAESLVTVELDPARAEAARVALADAANVTVLQGDWRDALPQHAPLRFRLRRRRRAGDEVRPGRLRPRSPRDDLRARRPDDGLRRHRSDP